MKITNNKRILFLQPIVSHYRKSVVEEIVNKLPNAVFWGTSDYLNIAPLPNNDNVSNELEVIKFKFLGQTFWWYKNLFNKVRNENFDEMVISGINPLLINFNLIFLYYAIFTNKKVLWWSQGKKVRQGFLGRFSRRILYNLSDGIFVYSKNSKENLEAIGVKSDKLIVVNNALNKEDYGFYSYDLKMHKTNKDFRVLYSGRLSTRKKVILLLEAVKVIKEQRNIDLIVNIIGDGEEREQLENYTHIHDLKNVNFVGAKYGNEIHPYFLESSVFVCPGAVGLSIVHGFSFGLPILTGENDPMHSTELELLRRGENGDFFKLDDARSFADKILEWFDFYENNHDKVILSCVNSIKDAEYLPECVADKIVSSIIK